MCWLSHSNTSPPFLTWSRCFPMLGNLWTSSCTSASLFLFISALRTGHTAFVLKLYTCMREEIHVCCASYKHIPLLWLSQVVPHTEVIPCRFLRPCLFSALLNVQAVVVPDLGSFEESPRFAPSFQTSSFAAVFVEKAPLWTNLFCVCDAFCCLVGTQQLWI